MESENIYRQQKNRETKKKRIISVAEKGTASFTQSKVFFSDKSLEVKNNMLIDSVSDLCLKGYDIGLDNRLLRDSMPTENRNDILVAKIFDGLRKKVNIFWDK